MSYGANLNVARYDSQWISDSKKNDVIFNTIYSNQKILLSSGSNKNTKISITSNCIGINTIIPQVSLDINSTDGLGIPIGTTLQRPFVSNLGYIRYNTSIYQYEGYTNNNWVNLSTIIDKNLDTKIIAETSTNINNNQLQFYTSNIQAMIINSNQKIGINISNPVVSLDINSTDAIQLPSGTTIDKINFSNNWNNGQIRYNIDLDYFEYYTNSNWYNLNGIINETNSNYISLETFTGANNNQIKFYTSNIQAMIIDSNQNIGISNLLPKYELDVTGHTCSTSLITSDIFIGDYNNIFVNFSAKSNNIYYLNGNIGIGTTNTSTTLFVNSDISTSNITINNNLTLSNLIINTGTLNLNCITTFSNILTINSNVNLCSDNTDLITVNSTTIFNENVTLNNKDLTVYNTLFSNVILSNIYIGISNNLNINSNLTVASNIILNDILTINSNVILGKSISNSIKFYGTTIFNDLVTFSNNASASNLIVTNSWIFNSNMNLKSDYKIINIPDPSNDQFPSTKYYMDRSLLLNNLLTGLPIKNPVLLLIPEFTQITTDSSDYVSQIKDPLLGWTLSNTTSGTSGNQPKLGIDTINKRPYLSFDGTNDYLYSNNINISSLTSSPNYDSMTLFYITNPITSTATSTFAWGNSSTNIFQLMVEYNPNYTYGLNYLNNTTGKIISNTLTSKINQVNLYSYRKNGLNGQIWRNGSNVLTSSSLNVSLSSSSLAPFALSSYFNGTSFSKQNFYNLTVFNRSLSDIEMRTMHIYLCAYYGIKLDYL